MTKHSPQKPLQTNPAHVPLAKQPPVRRRKPSLWSKNIKHWVLGMIIVFVVVFLGIKAWEYYELHQEMIRVEQQQQQLEAEQRELEAEKAKYNDPKAVEQAAREQLGLVKPNEVPYIR
ncbi:MAG: cell division protein FtsL [Negativicoccus succinicivorans]|nr:cell division protein FtsL [Negativicoccus succinicivorans]